MSSLSNKEEHFEEQPMKKRRVDNLEEMSENAKPNEVNLPMEADNKDLELSKTMVDLTLPPSVGRHRKLPAELNSQIFYCLNLPTRRKFICGLGWDFYAMFRRIVLTKSKRLYNPKKNGWTRSMGNFTFSEDLVAFNNKNRLHNIYGEKEFPIYTDGCRTDGFPGTIYYYYEVKSYSKWCVIGLMEYGFNMGIVLADPNTYAIAKIHGSEKHYQYRHVPLEYIYPIAQGNVFGCGILMDPNNKLTLFFTLNGVFLEQQNPIDPDTDRIFPAIMDLYGKSLLTFEANFGDDKDKPFAYDIKNCPGMGLDCI